jgi:glycosyl transferase family 25
VRILYINIDRRTDRRDYMEGQFAALGMKAERIAASVPEKLTALDTAPLGLQDAHRWLTPVEVATSVSHFRAWRRFLDEGDEHALILEDDAQLSARLPAFLEAFEAAGGFPQGVVRLETRLRGQVLARRVARRVMSCDLHHPFTWEWGAAGYIMSADNARRILASEDRFVLPIDDILLSPQSPLYDRSRVLQAVPALVFVPHEDDRLGNQPASVRESDAQSARSQRFLARKPPTRSAKVVREVRRIQGQIAQMGTFLRHRVLGRRLAVPFVDQIAVEPTPLPSISARSSSAQPPA